MDRRSWLWRRKSSEKSPGETDSSDSISSHWERFSDDQACSNHSSQSTEVILKAVATDEDVNDNMKILKEKLSAALFNISSQEELVKQHMKVAEEAVSGWEKAESEVLALKQQLEAAVQKNSMLEDRVGHLDGALKECLRQLRQAREEHVQKIQESVKQKTLELESRNFELESQLLELQAQLQTAKNEAAALVNPDLHPKLEALEKENSDLKLKLLSRVEELEVRITERDFSTQAAEVASKQHLESLKKLARLEAECCRLKAVARKASPANDHKSFTASSIYVESFTDSQSDSGERLLAIENDMCKMHGSEINECEPRHSDPWASALITELDQFKNEKAVGRNLMISSMEINLMDDFLEMERLAALPDTDSGSGCLEAGPLSDQLDGIGSPLKTELETMVRRTAELERTLEKIEAEKLQLELALTDSEKQVETLKNQLKEVEGNFVQLQKMEARKLELGIALTGYQKQLETLQNQVKKADEKLIYLEKVKTEKLELEEAFTGTQKELQRSQKQLKDAEENLVEVQAQLDLASNAKQVAEEEVKAANMKREAAESRLRDLEADVKSLISKIACLEEETARERVLSAKNLAKCHELQDELSKVKHEVELQDVSSGRGELKMKQEKELALAANKFAECQKTIASLGQQLKSLAALEDFLVDPEKPLELKNEGEWWPPHGREPWKLIPDDSNLPQKDFGVF